MIMMVKMTIQYISNENNDDDDSLALEVTIDCLLDLGKMRTLGVLNRR